MIRTLHVLVLSVLLSATPALAQVGGGPSHMDELRAQLASSGKQSVVSRQMALNPAEEAGFWPIYDEHQRALESLQQRQRELANAYAAALASGGLDDRLARDLSRELVAISADEAKLMDRTYSRLRRSLSESQALRYLELEARLSALQRYDLAASMP